MSRSHKQITIVRSKYTKKAWLADVNDKRITQKFKINRKINVGKFVLLETSKGRVIYHRHKQQLIYNDIGMNKQAPLVGINKLSKDIYVVKLGPGDYRMYTGEGELICDDILENVVKTNINLIAIRKDGMWGLMDENLNWIFIPTFHTISEFNENGCAIVGLDEGAKLAVIDKHGNYVLDPRCYQAARFISSNLLVVINEGKHGVINLKGEKIIPLQYDTIVKKHNFFIIQKDDKYGIMDIEGRILFQCGYSSIIETEDRFIIRNIRGNLELKFS